MNQDKTMPAEKPLEGRPYKRRVRNIFIHKPMQREFTFILIGLLIVSSLAITFVIHYTIRGAASGGGFYFGRLSPYEILSDVSYQLIFRVSCILFLTIVMIGIFGIFFLHRVAGPVYRFRQVFLQINRGEIPRPIKLREGDFFHETAVEINHLVKRLELDEDQHKQLEQKINAILAANPPEAVARQAKEMKAVLKHHLGEPKGE